MSEGPSKEISAAGQNAADPAGRPLPPPIGKKFLIAILAVTAVLFITLLSLSIAHPAMEKLRNAPVQSDSTVKMERLGVCLIYYAAKNGGRLPAKLSELLKGGYVKDVSAYDASGLQGEAPKDAEGIDSPSAKIVYLLKEGGTLDDAPQEALKLNSPSGPILSISKKGISWGQPPLDASKP